ncbi:hypothetical protein EDD22DRAFT_958766 [Suillus occidentalis]|nr:hypothetical protein EDD22DRAFT_958766 [Suillus occidentalis]
MRNQPKLRSLRKCTSLEWIHNASKDGGPDGGNDGRMVIRVGQDVAIFPLDDRAVPLADGSLPVMSYWYGSVVEIYMKAGGHTQDVWLDIQWYYRRVDLEDQGVDLAACVGKYELVLSNHTII